MKNKSYRLLSVLLSILVLVSACICPAVVNAATEPEVGIYYVKSGGTGDGRTDSTPAATVADVIATIQEDGLVAGETATIYILQRTDWNEYNGEEIGKIDGVNTPQPHNMTSWSADGSAMTEHAFDIVVKSPEGQNNYLAYCGNLGENYKLTLGGSTVFDNVTLVAMRNELDQPLAFKGYSAHFTENFVFGYVNCTKFGTPAVWNGTVLTTAPSFRTELSHGNTSNYTAPNAMTVILDSKYDSSIGTKAANRKFFIGTGVSGGYASQFNGDVTIVINNKDSYIPIQWGNTSDNQYSKVTFKKNLNLNIKAANTIVNTAGGSTFTVAGGLQMIVDNDTTMTDLETTLTTKGITSYWYLVNEVDADVLSFTETAGTFKVKDGAYVAVVKDGTTDEILPDEEGNFVLEAGKYTIIDKTPVMPKMVEITSNHTGPFGNQIAVTAGETYTFKFGISDNLDFNVVMHDKDSRHTKLNATVNQISKDDSADGYTYYEYEVTVPSDYAKSTAVLGVTFNGTAPFEGYFFEASAYLTSDTEKTELITNGGFADGYLNNWVWKYHNFGLNDYTEETFTEDSKEVTVKVIDFDESLMTEFEVIPEITTPKMVRITSNHTGPFGKQISVTAGETYTFKFGLSNTLDCNVVMHDRDVRSTDLNATAILKNSEDNGRYTYYEYEVTVPDTYAKDGAILGITFNGTAPYEGYFFNASAYKTSDAEQTELIANGYFANGTLNGWVWKYHNFGANNLTNETFTQDSKEVTVEVVDFDENRMIDTTPKMLHINSQNAGPIGQCIPATAGETYTFKFEISNNAKFDVIVNDNNRRHIELAAQAVCVSQEDKGRYSVYEYQVKMPYDLKDTYALIGLKFKGVAPYDYYLMNTSVYKTSDAQKTELLTNSDFMCGYLDGWVFKYTNFTSGNNLGLASCTFKEDNKEVTLEVLKFNESVMAEVAPVMPAYGDYMLYVNSQNRGPLGQAVAVTAGESYTFNFEISDNAKFDVTARDNDNRQSVIPAKIECVNQEDKGKYSAYEYKITIPDDFKGNYAFIGVKFTGTASHECYFTNASVYKTSDTNKQEMFKNGGFKNGYLDGWTWYNNGFTSGDNLCLTETTFTTEEQSVSLSVLTFDETIMPGEKQMMLLEDARTTTNELFVLETQTLKANVEYTLSFDYRFESGALNKTLYYYVCGGVNDPGSLQTVSKEFYSTREENENLFTTISNNGRNFVATFTLSEEQVDAVSHFYAGFKFLTLNTKTKLYFANMTLYETGDANKTNLFLNDEFATEVYNWYSHWGKSMQGGDVFGRSNIEFTARYLPYDGSLFEPPIDTHYGDTDFDGDIDILDLVKADSIVSGTDYNDNVDVNNDGMLTAHDISDVKMHMIGSQPIEWVQKGHGLMEGANLSGGADAQADELKNQILSATDTLERGSILNRVFYVAADGKDSNNGLSESAPITINEVSSLTLYSGDLVLFKRGDTFRLSAQIKPVDGVSYGAYGDANKPKPQILGSLKNYADESLWTTDDNIIWKVYLGTSEAALVVFNDGEWVGSLKPTLDEVINDGDFYYDTTEMVLYLYLNQINPAKYFDSIEIATTMKAFNKHGDAETNDNKFENLCFKYFTFGAMNLSFTDNVQITNCEMGWLGGCFNDSGTNRLGNAIQLWRHSNNTNISNNYIYQVFDAAITFQGSQDNDYTNLTFNDNLIEYCSMNFEFWGNDKDDTDDDPNADIYTTMHNIAFEDNILRFAGYGFGGIQRSTQENQAFILCWNKDYNEGQIQDFTIKNNIFDIANCNYYYGTPTLKDVDVSSNTYYQSSGSNMPVVKGQKYYCDDITAFETAIKEVDSNPTKVEWVN